MIHRGALSQQVHGREVRLRFRLALLGRGMEPLQRLRIVRRAAFTREEDDAEVALRLQIAAGRRFGEPLDRLGQVARNALAGVVHGGDVDVGLEVALRRCLLEELQRRRGIAARQRRLAVVGGARPCRCRKCERAAKDRNEKPVCHDRRTLNSAPPQGKALCAVRLAPRHPHSV